MNMKKIVAILMLTACLGMAYAQEEESHIVPMSFDTVGADTTRAIKIIDSYLEKIDFSQANNDSVLCVVSYVVDRSHPHDTMTVYRWYMRPYYNRIEIWKDRGWLLLGRSEAVSQVPHRATRVGRPHTRLVFQLGVAFRHTRSLVQLAFKGR